MLGVLYYRTRAYNAHGKPVFGSSHLFFAVEEDRHVHFNLHRGCIVLPDVHRAQCVCFGVSQPQMTRLPRAAFQASSRIHPPRLPEEG